MSANCLQLIKIESEGISLKAESFIKNSQSSIEIIKRTAKNTIKTIIVL